MTRDEFCAYAKAHLLAVLASTSADGAPQAANAQEFIETGEY